MKRFPHLAINHELNKLDWMTGASRMSQTDECVCTHSWAEHEEGNCVRCACGLFRQRESGAKNADRVRKAVSAAGLLLALCLGGCAAVRPHSDPLRTATSIGRIACAVITSEGGPAEVLATHTALDAIDAAFGHGADVQPQLVLLPRRVQGYVALLLAETADRTPDEFRAAVLAFVAGCRRTLVSGPARRVGEADASP